jgi:hypothetical protein
MVWRMHHDAGMRRPWCYTLFRYPRFENWRLLKPQISYIAAPSTLALPAYICTVPNCMLLSDFGVYPQRRWRNRPIETSQVIYPCIYHRILGGL